MRMHRSGLNLVVRWLILAAGVALGTWLVPGIHCDSGVTLVVVVLLLSLFNAILKPLLVAFTLPFVLVTFGLGVWLINAFLFLLVGRLVEGFHVRDFWSALWGALVISLTNLFLSGLFRTRVVISRPPPRPPDDVIDI